MIQLRPQGTWRCVCVVLAKGQSEIGALVGFKAGNVTRTTVTGRHGTGSCQQQGNGGLPAKCTGHWYVGALVATSKVHRVLAGTALVAASSKAPTATSEAHCTALVAHSTSTGRPAASASQINNFGSVKYMYTVLQPL